MSIAYRFRPGPKPGTVWFRFVSWFYGLMGWQVRPHIEPAVPLPVPPPKRSRSGSGTGTPSHAGFIVPYAPPVSGDRPPMPDAWSPLYAYPDDTGGYVAGYGSHAQADTPHHTPCDASHGGHHYSLGGDSHAHTPCEVSHSHDTSGGHFGD